MGQDRLILTAKKVFLILVFSFNLVHLPFVTAMFGFLVVWSVLGKKWAFIVFVITSIPDWIVSAYQTAYSAAPLIGILSQAFNCVSLGQDFHNRQLVQPCMANLLNFGLIGQFLNSFPKATDVLPFQLPSFLTILLTAPYSLYWAVPTLAIIMPYTIIYWIRRVVKIKNQIRKSVGGLYQFEPFKDKHKDD